MKHLKPLLSVFLALVVMTPEKTRADEPTRRIDNPSDVLLAKVDFDQRLGNQIPLSTQVQDGLEPPTTIAEITQNRPSLLALVYAECPNLCGLSFQGIAETLRDLKWQAGRDFELILLSLDPNETPAAAEEKSRLIEKRAGFRHPNMKIHFVRAQESDVRRVADSIGLHYTYDSKTHQYLHPAGIVVLTPEGKVSKYFFGVRYSAPEVQRALENARQLTIGSVTRKLLLYCFHYDPKTGRYGRVIVGSLRGLGIVLLISMAFFFRRAVRLRRV